MTRIFATLLLLLTFALSVQAQKTGEWASARERGLKGSVRKVIEKWFDGEGHYLDEYGYEFARDGKEMSITAPQFSGPTLRVFSKLSERVTKRNSRGDIEEVSFFIKKMWYRKIKYLYEYDDIGNWLKIVAYEAESRMAESEWHTVYVCQRTIEYYP